MMLNIENQEAFASSFNCPRYNRVRTKHGRDKWTATHLDDADDPQGTR